MTIRTRITDDNPVLLDIWHRAVKATHTFLSEQDIAGLYPQVRDLYLPSVTIWVAETGDGRIAGFIGTNDAQIEMLFVDPDRFGQRVGTRLLDHVRAQHPHPTVDVNEQNPGAHAFYRRYGFRDIGRSETDAAGRPFPLIHMTY
ncbi:GNAT family N-acetyltransferase [Burkholderia stagnalis]|uniref:GNAT family N-acetyltransferase n=1 Tax=Burkholderia stagnalis TaxID=1503054 RepID=UPI00075EB9D1|nr:GNAT family N-acetyltransferase [Burkholderia stagnalis]KVC64027.1 GNAT family acetyltransferase [Burkholderia stagnalis]KVN10889.1 GNAT family acetyltransferase [Burkholderia stagnalis]KWI66443.1 GNAT family acetyltransferase [Burkholderia stagnalis]KWK66961.1 GNAT family acetyltransferase [Burkholderia stagnalis]KWN14589.1 GNAT family acetyltransferase [Burkholderia stagnalis]